MIKLVRNEIYKILRQKKLYIFMAILAIFNFINCVGVILINEKGINKSLPNPRSFNYVNGQFIPFLVLQGTITIAIIFATILTADTITEENKDGSLNLLLIRPVDRINVLLSKVISVLLGTITLFAFSLVTSYLLGTILLGFGDKFIPGIQGRTYSTIDGIIIILKSYVSVLLPLLAYISVVTLISLLCTNSGITIGLSIGVWFMLSLTENLVKEVRPYLINANLYFYRSFVTKLNSSDIIKYFIVTILYILVFMLLSLFIFRKKDILR